MNLIIRESPIYLLRCPHCGFERRATADETIMAPDNRPKCPHGCEEQVQYKLEKRLKEPGEDLLK